MSKRITALIYVALLLIGTVASIIPTTGTAHAYSNSRLMDDVVFDNTGTMNEDQIQVFLANNNSCLANYQQPDPNISGVDGNGNAIWTYTGSVRAAHVIAKAAWQWGMNPQVILATLQKEESLITMSSCSNVRLTSAMGYGCPDGNQRYDYPAIGVTGTCVSRQGWAGFTRQVLWGSWQLKFNKERSIGNTSWDGDDAITYGSYMTQGTYKRCGSCSAAFYSGDATIDGQVIHLENGTTASLYAYTPHLGQAFPGIFQGWFGSTTDEGDHGQLITKLYRLYKKSNDRHFYSSSIPEVNTAMGQGYALEGVSQYISNSGGGSLAPVYRLYNKSSDYHFYTNNRDEANRDTGLGFTLEGVGFYASNGGDPGAAPVYRLLNRNGTHFFTTNAGERDQAVRSGSFSYEGIAWFAVPN